MSDPPVTGPGPLSDHQRALHRALAGAPRRPPMELTVVELVVAGIGGFVIVAVVAMAVLADRVILNQLADIQVHMAADSITPLERAIEARHLAHLRDEQANRWTIRGYATRAAGVAVLGSVLVLAPVVRARRRARRPLFEDNR